MRKLDGMSVLVTGGGSGLGAAVARHFAERGALVTIAGRRREKIEALAADIGPACRAVTGDVTSAADRAAMVAAAVEHGSGLGTVVHAAGNLYRAPLAELEEDKILDVFHSNVVGALMLSSLALPYLEASHGALIFFGSVHTVRAFPGATAYAASKGALETATRVLAAELGPKGVRVSCVRPGGVFTELNQRAGLFPDDATALRRLEGLASAHALGRIGTPEEIAEAVEYLAAAEWTTGGVLTVDGGLALGVTNG